MTQPRKVSRRAVLASTTATVAGAGILLGGAAQAGATANAGEAGPAANAGATKPDRAQSDQVKPDPAAGRTVRGSFKVVDRRGRQRFLADSRKPPLIVGGRTHPPSQRSGPDDATWLIFNDDDGNEIGGLVAGVTGAGLTLDYPGAVDGISMATSWSGQRGGAGLTVRGLAPGDRPAPGARATERVLLGWHVELGATLQLLDSRRRPRIVLQVDADDVATIKVLDANGAVTAQLPPR